MCPINTSNSFINYLFIFLTINYNLLVKFVIRIDSTGYGLIFLSLLVFLINFTSFKKLLTRKPIVFWLIWCLFALVNYYLHSHTSNILFFTLYRKIFIPLIVMTIVVLEYKKNPIKLIWLCFYTHFIFFIAGSYFDSGVLHRDLGVENELGNSYANISLFNIFYLVLLNNLKKIKTPIFLTILMILLLVLAMSGTRKAFGSGVILSSFWILTRLNLKSISSWFLVGLLVIVSLWGYNYLIDHTYMGYRMEVLEAQQEENIYGDIPAYLNVLGDRAPLYYFGFLIFLSNPIFGVGLLQSQAVGKYIHSEYVVQLADNGIVGFILFACMYVWIFRNLLKQVQQNTKIGLSMCGGLAVLLFMFLTTWAWEFPQYFICAGILIGYCQSPANLR